MIFAEIQYSEHYSEVHTVIVNLVRTKFSNVECGQQGDSWIWILQDDEKVEIDSFSSMKHQIKSTVPHGQLVYQVIDLISTEFCVNIYQNPELEPHE